jgi:PfaB family protein
MTADTPAVAIVGVAAQLAGVMGREAWTTLGLEGRDLPAIVGTLTPDGLIEALGIELCNQGLPGDHCEVLMVGGAAADAVLVRWPSARALDDFPSALDESLSLLARGAERIVILIVADTGRGLEGVGLSVRTAGQSTGALCELRSLRRGATVAELLANLPQEDLAADHLEFADVELLRELAEFDVGDVTLGCGVYHLPLSLREALAFCKLALALERAILPAWPVGHAAPESHLAACPQRLAPWPMRASTQPRRGAWCARSSQGVVVVLLESSTVQRAPARARLADHPQVLLPFAGASVGDIANSLDAFVEAGALGETDMHALACRAHTAFANQSRSPFALALVAGDHEALRAELTFFSSILRNGADLEREWRTPTGSAFTARPLRGQVAFVYPGYASAYPGAGRALSYLAPIAQRRLETRFGRQGWAFLHADRLYPRREDRSSAEPAFGSSRDDIRALCETTISLSTIYTELALSVFGIQPRFAFGYSIGEVAMLFALGIWDDLADFGKRVGASGLFESRLCGPMLTVRDHWRRIGIDLAADRDAWSAVLIRAPVNEVLAAASAEPGAMVSLVNTPMEAVVAGHPDCVARVAAQVGATWMALSPALPLHCAAVASERPLLARLHDLPSRQLTGTRLYSSAGYAPIAQKHGQLNEVIASAYTQPVDFPRLVRQVHCDGARVFVETGPRRICSTWIETILDGKPHVTVPMDIKGVDNAVALLKAAAVLVTHRVPLDLQALYAEPSGRVSTSVVGAVVGSASRPAFDPEVGAIVAIIVAEVARTLRCPPGLVDVTASLFGLGLDSLQAAELAVRADRDFGVRLELADVIAGDSVAGLARLIHRRRLVRQVGNIGVRGTEDNGWKVRI